ncbi:hypothetical protein [Aurantimonas sp. VKM B-3413]|uniref:hypothetical protein n=1 Tax=Aurantimonas sp. VKM B-3413 TaxID=2779401 RepID=UPI001E3C392C|nr:hypothetical protein [Aurantimonas sp. VKM B-3413]MCB8840152.1 hypothetical protein [Aurantimonas sp. VKM B-3413]
MPRFALMPSHRRTRPFALFLASLALSGAVAGSALAEDTGADGKSGRVIPKAAQSSAPDLAPAETTPAPAAGPTPPALSQPESDAIEEAVPSNEPKPIEPQATEPRPEHASPNSAPAAPDSTAAPEATTGEASGTIVLPNDDTPDTEMPTQGAPDSGEAAPAR